MNNFVEKMEGLARTGDLDGWEVFMATDSTTFEAGHYNGENRVFTPGEKGTKGSKISEHDDSGGISPYNQDFEVKCSEM